MFLYGVFAIILCMYDITYTHSLFWITMLFLSLIQFFAYANGLRAQLERQFLKDYGDFLGTKKWKWVDDLTITLSNGEKCFFTHGRSADVLKVSQTMGMSAVQGHYHTAFTIKYWANPDRLFWAMNVGCLINQKNLAFAYSKNHKTRFIVGCGVIIDGIPRLLPMVLNNKGRWIKKIV